MLDRLRSAAASVVLLGCCVAAAGRDLAPPVRDPRHFTAEDVSSWKAIKQRNVVMQQRDYSCGAAVLATVIRYYWGEPATEDKLLEAISHALTPEQMQDRVKNGLTMTDLRNAAVEAGYLAMMGKRSIRELIDVKSPVIVRIKLNGQEHFVVYRGAIGDRVFLADPLRGNVRVSVSQFCRQWTDGVVLVVAKKDATDLPQNAPLALKPVCPVQPEMQAVRRELVLEPSTQLRTSGAVQVLGIAP